MLWAWSSAGPAPCLGVLGPQVLGSDSFLSGKHSGFSDAVPEDVWTGLDIAGSSRRPVLGVGSSTPLSAWGDPKEPRLMDRGHPGASPCLRNIGFSSVAKSRGDDVFPLSVCFGTGPGFLKMSARLFLPRPAC